MRQIIWPLIALVSSFQAHSFAQNYPSIGAYTVLPAFYTATTVPTKIVTKTMIVHQGQHLGTSFTINSSSFPKKIELKGCYFDGQILPATQTFIDTFYVGILPVGSYTVSFKAYLSSSSSSCIPVDSNSVSFFHDVPIVESVDEWQLFQRLQVYPNPARDVLYLPIGLSVKSVSAMDINGCCVSLQQGNEAHSYSLEPLNEGLYVLLVQSSDRLRKIRFVKLK